MHTDPDSAVALLREAQDTTISALEDLRTLVRGIHPPVLADRGLVAAIEALAIPIPIPVTVALRLPRLAPRRSSRPPTSPSPSASPTSPSTRRQPGLGRRRP